VSLLVVLAPSTHGGQAETREYATRDGRHIAVQRQVLYDPESSLAFSSPGNLVVEPVTGNIFVVDFQDRVVRVLDPDGVVLREIGGGPGQGPGEFDVLNDVALMSDGRVALLDTQIVSISTFDSEGTFVERQRISLPALQAANGFVVLGDSEFVLGTTGLNPKIFGNAAHVFDMADDGVAGLDLRRSFIETIEIAPGFYQGIAGGRIARDLDGGILYSQNTPYSLRKYSADGREVFRLDAPEAFRAVMDHYRFLPNGAIVADFYPRSFNLLPLAENRYLHTIFRPRDDWTAESDFPPYVTQLEVLAVKNGEVVDVIVVDLDEWVYFYGTDGKGGVVGYEDDGNVIVRWTFEIPF
jgi:hypothetical protein